MSNCYCHPAEPGNSHFVLANRSMSLNGNVTDNAACKAISFLILSLAPWPRICTKRLANSNLIDAAPVLTIQTTPLGIN